MSQTIYIPTELQSLKQWITWRPGTPNKKGKYTKMPNIKFVEHDKHLAFSDAFHNGRYGFVPYHSDDILLIDIDNTTSLEDLPQGLQDWITTNTPYTEITPSGNGLRVVAKLTSGTTKEEWEGNIATARPGLKYVERLTFADHYQTFTNDVVIEGGVPEIPGELLNELFYIKKKGISDTPVIDITTGLNLNTMSEVPPIEAFREKLLRIPSDGNPRIQKIYEEIESKAYVHYDFWLMVAMSCKNYGMHINDDAAAYKLFDEWSALDVHNYKGQDDTYHKWSNVDPEKARHISWRTVGYIGDRLQYDWPLPIIKKGKSTGYPQPSQLDNFYYLMQFYSIEAWRDELDPDAIYLSGDDDLLTVYFGKFAAPQITDKPMWGPIPQKQLHHRMHEFLQRNKYNSVQQSLVKTLVDTWISAQDRSFNILKEYYRAEAVKVPESFRVNHHLAHTFDDLWSCVNVQKGFESEIPLYKEMFRKWFFIQMKNLYYDGDLDTDNAVLVLTGPQNCRKSTFIRLLLPKHLREKYIRRTNENLKDANSMRTASKIAASSIIMEWDEGDRILDEKYDSAMKAFITEPLATFRDLYEKDVITIRKRAAYAISTNSDKLSLGRDGVRRFWIIPVQFMDTDKLLQLNLHSIYRQLYDEFQAQLACYTKGCVLPWCLTSDQIVRLETATTKEHTAKSSLGLILDETFDSGNQSRLAELRDCVNINKWPYPCRLGQITTYIKMNASADIKMTPAHLKRELEQLCARYTDTQYEPKTYGNYVVTRGKVKVADRVYYIIPPEYDPEK